MVSIVIPLYNAEEYISNTLDSLVKQTCNDFEIIIVNDGSIDRGRGICEKYKNIISNLKIIDQENGGVSKARNVGIELAMGEYITFIDADDWVERDFIESLVNEISEENVDMICTGATVSKEGRILSKPEYPKIKVSSLEAINCRRYFYYEALWGKLFKKEIINKYDIRFNSKIQIGEDMLFFTEYALKCQKIIYTGGGQYHYLIYGNSAMSSLNIGKQLSDLYAREIISDLIIQYPRLKKEYDCGYISSCMRIYKLFCSNKIIRRDLRCIIQSKIKGKCLGYLIDRKVLVVDKIKVIMVLVAPNYIERKWSR